MVIFSPCSVHHIHSRCPKKNYVQWQFFHHAAFTSTKWTISEMTRSLFHHAAEYIYICYILYTCIHWLAQYASFEYHGTFFCLKNRQRQYPPNSKGDHFDTWNLKATWRSWCFEVQNNQMNIAHGTLLNFCLQYFAPSIEAKRLSQNSKSAKGVTVNIFISIYVSFLCILGWSWVF